MMFVLQAEAIGNGLHHLLLNCVADTHALLALKAFQPSQPTSAPNTAQVTRTDHEQARTAARATGTARRRPPGAKHGAALETGRGQFCLRGPIEEKTALKACCAERACLAKPVSCSALLCNLFHCWYQPGLDH